MRQRNDVGGGGGDWNDSAGRWIDDFDVQEVLEYKYQEVTAKKLLPKQK